MIGLPDRSYGKSAGGSGRLQVLFPFDGIGEVVLLLQLLYLVLVVLNEGGSVDGFALLFVIFQYLKQLAAVPPAR